MMGEEKGLIVLNLKKVQAQDSFSPKHIRFQRKDYIVMPLDNNELKIVSRTGLDRINVKGKINFSENGVFSYLNTFCVTDSEGNLIQVDTGKPSHFSHGLVKITKLTPTKSLVVTLSDSIILILRFASYPSLKLHILKYFTSTIHFT